MKVKLTDDPLINAAVIVFLSPLPEVFPASLEVLSGLTLCHADVVVTVEPEVIGFNPFWVFKGV